MTWKRIHNSCNVFFPPYLLPSILCISLSLCCCCLSSFPSLYSPFTICVFVFVFVFVFVYLYFICTSMFLCCCLSSFPLSLYSLFTISIFGFVFVFVYLYLYLYLYLCICILFAYLCFFAAAYLASPSHSIHHCLAGSWQAEGWIGPLLPAFYHKNLSFLPSRVLLPQKSGPRVVRYLWVNISC